VGALQPQSAVAYSDVTGCENFASLYLPTAEANGSDDPVFFSVFIFLFSVFDCSCARAVIGDKLTNAVQSKVRVKFTRSSATIEEGLRNALC